MTQKLKYIWILFLIFSQTAMAGLQVFPTRVFLNDKIKAGQLGLRHQGTTATRYRISTVYYKMGEDGSMNALKKPDGIVDSAIPYIKFSPRVVTLQPNVEQVVRVLSAVPKDLPPGEYRAHLYFEEADEAPTVNKTDSPENEAKMTLNARMAIAVPVIIRKGEPTSELKLGNLKIVALPDQKQAFSVEMDRAGKKFVYGDFRVYFKDKTGKEYLIGMVNGVSSYIDKRKAVYPLQLPLPVEIKNGILRVEFLDPSAEGGKLQASTQTEIH